MARHSPCIGICKLDDATGFCLGCGRTGAEIGDWMAMSESQRDAVWEKLPERLALLSARVRLLPWIRDELVDWIRDCIVGRLGAWSIGVPGALAEFPTTGNVPIDIHVEAGVITARRPDAAFRIAINEKIRAFSFTQDGPIVLGYPRGRAMLSPTSSLQSLGPDPNAIDGKHQGDRLFDIGIDRRYARFCVRSNDQNLAAILDAQSGRHWSEAMPLIIAPLIDAAAHRVVETATARMEVFTPIPRPNEVSPSGAYTHFLPEFLKSGEDISPSLALPDYAAPVTIFYPNKI